MKKISTILLLFTYYLLLVTPLRAQSVLGLSAIPPRLEVSLQPGATITKEIKVRNESKSVKIIDTSVKDFLVLDDLGTPKQIDDLDEISNRWAASTWIQVSPSRLRLLPGETRSLQLTVITPDDAAPGGHYAVVLHTPQQDGFLTDTGAFIQTNVGTLVYITVPGDISENALVRDFSAPFFSEYGPINFTTVITNLSDIHITPAGSIRVKNWLGGTTASLSLLPTNIFPNVNRTLNNVLDKKWLLGRYTATLTAAYGSTGQALAATLIFWVIPWRLIILLLLTLAILVVLILLLKQKHHPVSLEDQVDQLSSDLENLKKKYRDRR